MEMMTSQSALCFDTVGSGRDAPLWGEVKRECEADRVARRRRVRRDTPYAATPT